MDNAFRLLLVILQVLLQSTMITGTIKIMYLPMHCIIIGASLSEPHTSELVLKNLLRCMYNFRDVRVRSGTVLIRIYLIACSKISINQLAS